MNVQELLKDPGASVVDVRSAEEFAMGHYPGAMNIPLDQVPQQLEKFREMTAPVLVYCRSGNRSGIAQQMLQQAGVTEVYNIGGLSDIIHLKRK